MAGQLHLHAGMQTLDRKDSHSRITSEKTALLHVPASGIDIWPIIVLNELYSFQFHFVDGNISSI